MLGSLPNNFREKTMIKGMDIAAYLVRDPQAAIAFYRDVLGIQPTEIDGATGGAVMFAVDDAKAAVEHYRGRGLELSDIMESPVCFMSFGQDPEGNAIIIHQRKS
jgi:predicted enzyme related to lactoylglutathione lyase